eukprot:SAG11_NODE_302_length_11005_cov_12.491748_10_plen_35_part_00
MFAGGWGDRGQIDRAAENIMLVCTEGTLPMIFGN